MKVANAVLGTSLGVVACVLGSALLKRQGIDALDFKKIQETHVGIVKQGIRIWWPHYWCKEAISLVYPCHSK
jgi:hypothetical protein